ncbi:MAG: SDR family oxidoreductase [Zhengella sp.]|uniref:SDR family oxidoreductase n=1 Tax=Zhengella sp. TaxID=2282762 RepID=UPI003527BE2F
MTGGTDRQDGRLALVTGAANGIGWATCRQLAAGGYRIALADIDGEAARARAGELGPGHVALPVDLTDRAAASALPARAVAALGGLDVIVNNAGVTDTSGKSIADLPEAAFQRLVDLNLLAVEAICAAAADILQAGSAIVNLASGASWRPLALRGPYSATKAGIVALTQAWANRLAPRAIAVAAIAPGYTRTPLVEELHRAGRVDLDKVALTIPLGRLAMPEDIASVIVFAASHEGRSISGETLLVDGGGSAGPPTPGTAPEPGSKPQGRIAVIGGGPAFAGETSNEIVRLADPAQIGAAGPLRAVIDMRLLNERTGAAAALGAVRETALACAAHKARTRDFALLHVLGEGDRPETAAAIAASEMLARTIALEWAPAGIRVNALRWRGETPDGLDPLCRFLVGAGAGMIVGQAIAAGAAQAAMNPRIQ